MVAMDMPWLSGVTIVMNFFRLDSIQKLFAGSLESAN